MAKKHIITRYAIGKFPRVRITEKRFMEINNSLKNLEHLYYIEEIFDVLIENIIELEQDIANSLARHMIGMNFSRDDFNKTRRHAFNRRILNLLTSTKAYLDYTPSHLNKIFSSSYPNSRYFEKLASYQYDNILGYRVMEAMRNHAQHSAFLTHAITFSNRWEGKDFDRKLRI